MLKHESKNSITCLHDTINYIWKKHEFPNEWRKVIIIPIPKKNIERSFLQNYRPIALTSCFCKIMERIVKNRLQWYLEHIGDFNKQHCGFRKNYSTYDNLIGLENEICKGLHMGMYTFAIFFDLKSAFDIRYGKAKINNK